MYRMEAAIWLGHLLRVSAGGGTPASPGFETPLVPLSTSPPVLVYPIYYLHSTESCVRAPTECILQSPGMLSWMTDVFYTKHGPREEWFWFPVRHGWLLLEILL